MPKADLGHQIKAPLVTYNASRFKYCTRSTQRSAMDSSTSRVEQERQRQEDIKKKIAALQAQLPLDAFITPSLSPPASPKRKRIDSTTLVPPTPSPKKRKLDHRPAKQGALPSRTSARPVDSRKSKREDPKFIKPAPSNLLNSLAKLKDKSSGPEQSATVARSSGFADKPPPPAAPDEHDIFGGSLAPKRDDRLALVEELEPGPVDHIPPLDDPNFERLEPNSGIRLSSRTVSHEDLQDHLRGRYYLSPSQLYSSIRLLPDKLGYDVPVPGDWITIAVVAERGPMRFSKAPVAVVKEEGDDADKKKEHWKRRGKTNDEPSKPSGKKYVNIKLIDFGARSRSASSATGGKAAIRGDAFLSLLLFESDGFDLITDDGEQKPRKVYRGGSRGAFETMSKLKEGDVIALLNPRILRPYQQQRSNDGPHPTTNILAITPESASSIMGIGRAHDLGMCTVMKRDNTVCGSWVDKRVADVCEYHVQHAVQRRRAGRAEFSIGQVISICIYVFSDRDSLRTTGISSSSASRRKPPGTTAYDPTRQWGLKPEPTAGTGSTYIVSGHIVSDSRMDSRSLFATEDIGREGQAKAARKLSGRDADRALKNLLERDKEGMKAVMKAREVGKAERGKGVRNETDKGKGKEKSKQNGSGNEKDENKGKEKDKRKQKETKEENSIPTTKNAYSADVIKQLGFDPIAMAGLRRGTGDSDAQKKLRSLEALQSSRKEIILAPRPGQRIRSGVVAPITKPTRAPSAPRDFDDFNEDEVFPIYPGEVKEDVMIDLDDE
ncbi:hypothetical protein H0H81_009113 [Sphagnurus paluster]|uniref:Zinc finger Mcm10/DnaG-type domain-containing protein n=1 Tax=Sphagnurus paluster TaxID=117069 RepID=A0A9P7GQS4_9AGAR|nr:hypothetical protein H0H81_009113 [Sphagnurus paluster]